MSETLFEAIESEPHLNELKMNLYKCMKLNDYVLAALKLGFAIAALILEAILNDAGKAEDEYDYFCPICGARLNSKGLKSRTIDSLIGQLTWRRRVLRCPKHCEIGQIAPLDEKLDIKPYQRYSLELIKMACLLAVFIPYDISSKILNQLTGVSICANTIWNWVQNIGREIMEKVHEDVNRLESGIIPEAEKIDPIISELPMVIGADGVFVPFRPEKNTPKGKTVWFEVKIGIIARIAKRINSKGKEVSYIARKRLVAILGDINIFKPQLMLLSIKEGIKTAKQIAWISDGGKGFWGVHKDLFSKTAQGILDFYHASQNIWKAAKGWLDGRTSEAKNWFNKARKKLKAGKATEIIDELRTEVKENETLSDKTSEEMERVSSYLEQHVGHMDYNCYKKSGLPIGSGLVESACKWLIQQRFKGVGMRWSFEGFNNLLYLRLAWVNENYDDVFG